MRRKLNIWSNIDWLTVFIFLLFIILGWINIYAAVYDEDHHSIFDFSQRYGKQMVWVITAIVLAALVLLADSNFFTMFAYPIYLIVLIFLLLVLVVGLTAQGSRSWFDLGSFHLQPAEFAKVATALALAKYLSTFNTSIYQFKTVFKASMIIAIPFFLIMLQPDAGTALVFSTFILVLYREGLPGIVLLFAFILGLLFFAALIVNKFFIICAIALLSLIVFMVSTKKMKPTLIAFISVTFTGILIWQLNILLNLDISRYSIVLLTLALNSLVFIIISLKHKIRQVYIIVLFLFASIGFSYSVDYVYHNILKDHQQRRISILLGLEDDPLGVGYNVNQSKIAIGSGGLTGKGFLNGTQTKFNFVPEQSTDFIFCTIGEEWGFLGTSLTLIMFLILLFRIQIMAERQRSVFSRVYGYSVLAIFFFHITINIGMTIGIMPIIGIPLPFLSYGGSSLWAFTLLLFILIRLDATRLEMLR